MRRIISGMVLVVLASSCGTTNHLDKYPLRGAVVSFTTTIDPVPGMPAPTIGDDVSNSTPFLIGLTDLLINIFSRTPDSTMRDPSVAYFFEEGFRPELDSLLFLQEDDSTRLAECELSIRITDCDLHVNDSWCNVRFKETLHIAQNVRHATVFDESRRIEAPLRYCGSVNDSTSISGELLTKDSYNKLPFEEQLSALQCAAVDAGSRLADILAAFSELPHK
jgi:hypothetical protein